jgi:hypothetical protein
VKTENALLVQDASGSSFESPVCLTPYMCIRTTCRSDALYIQSRKKCQYCNQIIPEANSECIEFFFWKLLCKNCIVCIYSNTTTFIVIILVTFLIISANHSKLTTILLFYFHINKWLQSNISDDVYQANAVPINGLHRHSSILLWK